MTQKSILIFGLLALCLLVPGVYANTISITPANVQHQIGETQSFNVILDSAPDGLSGFNITLTVQNPVVAQIVSVSFNTTWASMPQNSTVPASSIWCKAVDMTGDSGTVNILLCIITVQVDSAGTTNITINPEKVEDRIGGRYTPAIVPAILTVTASPASGNTTIGMYRNGVYYLRNTNIAGNADLAFAYGSTRDTPVTGDWNGDGITTIGMYRDGVYYLRNTNDAGNADLAFAYGTTGDIPVTGDWNGDGITTIGMYRGGVYYLRNTNDAGNADLAFAYGSPGDIPVSGDWNGDGITTIGMYRDGVYYLRNTNDAGNADLAFAYGSTGDIPVTGDWNGDGITTIGMYRNGVYYLRNTNDAGNADLAFAYGSSGDIPVTGKWI